AYLRVRDAAAARLPRLTAAGVLALNGPFVYTRRTGAVSDRPDPADDYLYLIPPVVNNTPEFAFWRPEDETTVPGLLRSRHGEGAVVWLPWLAGEAYWLLRHAPNGFLLGDLVGGLLGTPQIETDAPPSVQMTLQRQRGAHDERYVLHLINGTGRESRALEQVIPLGAIRLRVATPGVKRARSLVMGQDVPAETRDEDGITFTLPRLGAYDVVVLE
ncbi:MAG: hypothetical protein ACRDJN_30945, partial [Chloroflexota bacterium]